jgi:very-short-patch-repair endonuclease
MAATTRIDEPALGRILDRQVHVITLAQTRRVGMTDHALRHRLRDGERWQRLLPRVYFTKTGTPSQAQREMAAMLYGGSGSVVTGPAALPVHRIRVPQSDFIDVLVPVTCQRRDAEFARLHRTSRMPGQIQEFGPIRYALAARAVGDTVRGMRALPDVRGVVADAVQRRRCGLQELVGELNAGPRRESALFREALAEVIGGSRSAAEAALRQLIIKSGLEMPLFNAEVYDGDEFIARPDAWYPELGIAIEVDSREWHLLPEDHANTLKRGNRMEKYLINVLRFTPNRIRDEPEAVMAEIRDAIERARGRPPLTLRTVPAA